MSESELPLSGLVVVDMSQFLSGPYCSLRLMDLGARVIKIERPDGGDLSRRLYLSDTEIGGDSTIFHAINRGKDSLAIDLKNPDDLAALKSFSHRPMWLFRISVPVSSSVLALITRQPKKSIRVSSMHRSAAMAKKGHGSGVRGRICWRRRAQASCGSMVMKGRDRCHSVWRLPICWRGRGRTGNSRSAGSPRHHQ